MITHHYCRACLSLLPEKEIIRLNNMPKSAQFFPTKEEIETEQGIDIVIKECTYCGLVQAIGEPVPYYRDVIRAVGVSNEMKKFRREQFSDWVKKNHLEGKRIIEIGAGHGEYMSMSEGAGIDVYGLEHAYNAVEEAASDGHKMIRGFVENENTVIEGSPYDGFYCLNFLEHIPSPGLFLKGIAQNLSDQAHGLIEVPNFDMVLEKSLYADFIQDHLSYFTSASLKNLVNNSGFEVVSINEVWYGYMISAEVVKREKTSIAMMNERRENLQKKISDYLSNCNKRGIKTAVWGAGHQALANISLLNLADKIECVIDSASFKQNKFTPATHLPVVSPDILTESGIDAVIIAAGGYSNEIRSFIKQNYPKIECSLLSDDFTIL